MGFQRYSDSLIVSISPQRLADIAKERLACARSERRDGCRQWRRRQLPQDELFNGLYPQETDGDANAAIAEASFAHDCPQRLNIPKGTRCPHTDCRLRADVTCHRLCEYHHVWIMREGTPHTERYPSPRHQNPMHLANSSHPFWEELQALLTEHDVKRRIC